MIGATVRLIYTEDTVTEGARFNPAVCAIVEGCGFSNPVLFPFEISLFTESKTASQYIAIYRLVFECVYYHANCYILQYIMKTLSL